MASQVPLINSVLDLKSDILKRFWQIDVADTEKYELYFKYYDGVCNRLRTSTEISAMDAKTHEDVFLVMDVIWKSADIQTLTRRELRQALRNSTQPSPDRSANVDSNVCSPGPGPSSVDDSRNDISAEQLTRYLSDDMMNNTINLSLRLWLTVDIRARQFGGVGDVQWNDDVSLRNLIDQQFPTVDKGAGASQSGRDVSLDEEFNALNLLHRRGIKTEFTDTLTHHLLFDPKVKTLMVYPLRHCLTLHKTCPASVLPKKLIDETIKSLGILFPQSPQTETFMRESQFKGRPGHDYPFPVQGSTRLSEFEYWQDRLAEIYFILKGPPTTWHQKLREDPAGWFSFWGAAVAITVMTFIFGSASVGLAAWSVLIAQQSLEIAREGLVLARDAVTSAGNAATSSAPTSSAVVKMFKEF